MKTCHWLAAAGCLLGILSLAGCVRAARRGGGANAPPIH